MKHVLLVSLFAIPFLSLTPGDVLKVFDVHIHGNKVVSEQLTALERSGVYKAALSSSWELQNSYRNGSPIKLLYGLMLPCPNGKVPYSLQQCFEMGQEWPSIQWVEDQIKNGKIDFLGEILTQYHGIQPSDSLMNPYYAIAEKYKLPAGIHTGGAGPNHGCPNFKPELGNPALLEKLILKFPKLKLWVMHSGDQFYKETIMLMRKYPKLYADISVISNPDILPQEKFSAIMKEFIEAGLEDRLMFGSDNGDIQKTIAAVQNLSFLSDKQKEKIFYMNAEHFFSK